MNANISRATLKTGEILPLPDSEKSHLQNVTVTAPAKRILFADSAAVEKADARIAKKFAKMFRKLAE